jgi:plastocyanin
MKRILLFGAAALAAMAFVSSANATVYEVSIVDFQFVPPAITIAVGDSIHWTNNGATPHTVTSGTDCTFDNDFDSGNLNPGQGFGYKADAEDAGLTKPYFCTYHCSMGMTGSYTVLEQTPAQQISWGKIKSLYKTVE